MENTAVRSFINRCAEEAKGVKSGIAPNDVSLSITNERLADSDKVARTLSAQIKGLGQGPLTVSPRAVNNILKLTGFSTRLFHELTSGQLEAGMRHQLAKYTTLGACIIEEEVKSLFNTSKFPYAPYSPCLPPAEQLVAIKGDPIDNDWINFQTREDVIDLPDSPIIVGMNTVLCSTGTVKCRFRFGLFRVRCSNGAVTPITFMQKADSIDATIMSAMTDAFRSRTAKYKDKINNFARLSKLVNLKGSPEILNELLEDLSVPTQVKSETAAQLTAPDPDLLKSAGVDSAESLWDIFNVLLFLTNNHPRVSSRLSMSLNIFKWAWSISSKKGFYEIRG